MLTRGGAPLKKVSIYTVARNEFERRSAARPGPSTPIARKRERAWVFVQGKPEPMRLGGEKFFAKGRAHLLGTAGDLQNFQIDAVIRRVQGQAVAPGKILDGNSLRHG